MTPIIVITGPLGSGKTTVLRHLLDHTDKKIAVLMNEFGDVGIDTELVSGKHIEVKELVGGCVCCSLTGAFEDALHEIVASFHPDYIVIETTGVAQPDSLLYDIEHGIDSVALHNVVTVVDADLFVRFSLGSLEKKQIAVAGVVVLNKTDVVANEDVAKIEKTIRSLNETCLILPAEYGVVATELLFERRDCSGQKTQHTHSEYRSFVVTMESVNRTAFEQLIKTIDPSVVRAKGFVQFEGGCFLVQYVRGRWSFEKADARNSFPFVVIGSFDAKQEEAIRQQFESTKNINH